MKRLWLITLLFCLLIFGGAAAVVVPPSVVPFEQCSDLYQQYAASDNVKATFVKDYRINDTISVDVTFLEATDSAGWAILCRNFAILDENPELEQIFGKGYDVVFTRQVSKYNHAQIICGDSCDVDLLSFSHQRKTVTVFNIENKDEYRAVLYNNLKENQNNNNEKDNYHSRTLCSARNGVQPSIVTRLNKDNNNHLIP